MELSKDQATIAKKFVTLPMQTPFHIAAARRMFVAWVTLPLVFSEAYWKTWYEVYREPQ